MTSFDDEDVGYGKPPVSTRFKKGQSGNPKGRPRGRHRQAPFDTVLGQKVTVREEGVEREVTAAEAFLLHLTKAGLNGDGSARRAAMTAIEDARQRRPDEIMQPTCITLVPVAPGGVTQALEPLRLGRKLDRFGDRARVMLEPWIVETALKRLGDRRLTRDEQRTVVDATRTPRKVAWPDWWEVDT